MRDWGAYSSAIGEYHWIYDIDSEAATIIVPALWNDHLLIATPLPNSRPMRDSLHA